MPTSASKKAFDISYEARGARGHKELLQGIFIVDAFTASWIRHSLTIVRAIGMWLRVFR